MAKRTKGKARGRIENWLLILQKPLDAIEFVPADFGVKAETIQAYITDINNSGPRKYRTREGGKRTRTGKVSRRVYRAASEPVYVQLMEV